MRLTFEGIRKIGAGAALAVALGVTSAAAEEVYKIGLAVPVSLGEFGIGALSVRFAEKAVSLSLSA